MVPGVINAICAKSEQSGRACAVVYGVEARLGVGHSRGRLSVPSLLRQAHERRTDIAASTRGRDGETIAVLTSRVRRARGHTRSARATRPSVRLQRKRVGARFERGQHLCDLPDGRRFHGRREQPDDRSAVRRLQLLRPRLHRAGGHDDHRGPLGRPARPQQLHMGHVHASRCRAEQPSSASETASTATRPTSTSATTPITFPTPPAQPASNNWSSAEPAPAAQAQQCTPTSWR